MYVLVAATLLVGVAHACVIDSHRIRFGALRRIEVFFSRLLQLKAAKWIILF